MGVILEYDASDHTFLNGLIYTEYAAAKASGAWHRKTAQNLVTRTSKGSRKYIVDFFANLPLSSPYWEKVAPKYFNAVEISILKGGNRKQIRATVENANWRLQTADEVRIGKKGTRQFGKVKIATPAPPGKGFGFATGTLCEAITFNAGLWEAGGLVAGFTFGLPSRLTNINGKKATQSVLATHEIGHKNYPARPVLHPALEKGIQKQVNFKELAKAYKANFSYIK